MSSRSLPAGPIRTVNIALPAYEDFEREVAEKLDAEEGDNLQMAGVATMVYLPGALWIDYNKLEEQARVGGWTLGRLIGYLAIRGAAALAAEADK